MNNRSLFAACTTQCVWCLEQWPVVEHRKHMVHVAPFTEGPMLFSRGCEAESIRRGFKYMDYSGGKRVKWKPPSVESLLNSLGAYYKSSEKSGLGKSLGSPGNRSFWRGGCRAVIEVASWPEWKRSTNYSGEPRKVETPEEQAASLKRVRDELLFYDAMDYWTRQPCSDNLQYRPHWNKARTNVAEPTCNGGVGCATCWALYEKDYDERSKNWCD